MTVGVPATRPTAPTRSAGGLGVARVRPVERVKSCAAGDFVAGPTVLARLVESYLLRPESTPRESAAISALTARERDVLGAMADGLSNAEIAQRLYRAENTVKTHVSRILDKLGARDRVQAIVIAHRTGLERG